MVRSSFCRLLYGPDRLPIEKTVLATEARCGYRPFHGIVSIGLRDHPACTPDRWHRAAPEFDKLPRHDVVLDDAARCCGLLSFDESLAAAAHAAAEYGNGSPPAELWEVKEGHTASVWCATFELHGDPNPRRIAIHVARDDVASRELVRATERFRVLGEREPDIAAARVLASWKLLRNCQQGDPVSVVAQQWIDDAREINAVPAGGERGQLCAVERFISDTAEPARIRSVRGRRLGVEEHERVGAAMARLLRKGAQRDPERGAWALPRFVLQHGDWIWQDGRALAVSCGAADGVIYKDCLEEAVHEAIRETCKELSADYARAVIEGAAAAF